MNKNIPLLLFTLFLTFSAIGQKPASIGYFRLGANVNFAGPKEGDNGFIMWAINATPGLRMIQGQDFALVLAMPVSVGISTNEDTHVSHLSVDLPVMLEFNFGTATGNSASTHPGIMIGAGAGYLVGGQYGDATNDETYGTRQLDFWGWRMSFGMCFGNEPDGTRVMVAVSYGANFTAEKKSMASLGLYFIMGNRKVPAKTEF